MSIGTPQTLAGGNAASGLASFLQVTVSATSAAGDAIAVLAANGGTNAVTGVTDSQGNLYVAADSELVNPYLFGYVAVQGPTAGSPTVPLVNGTDWIKAQYTGSGGTKMLIARNCSGIDPASAVNIAIATAATGTAVSLGPSSALARPSEWAIAGLASANSGGTPGSWTGGFAAIAAGSQHVASNAYLTWADQVTAAVTALTAGATLGGSTPAWSVIVMTLKAGRTASVAMTVPKPSTAAAAAVTVPFPLSPLDAAVDINLSGSWTDATQYAYQRAGTSPPVTISRGRPNQSSSVQPSSASLELNNRDGRWSPLNPSGAWYGSISRNTPVRVSVPAQNPYLRLEEDTSSYAGCPDAAGLHSAGDLDVRIDLNLSGYMPGVLAAKWAPGGAANSWSLTLNGDGTLTLTWSSTGSNSLSATSSMPVPLGRCMARAHLVAATGAVTFFSAPTMSGTQVQLGNVIAGAGATSVFGGTAPVTVGNYGPAVPGAGGLYGSTTNKKDYGLANWLNAAQLYDTYTGTSLATTVQRAYYVESQWPATPLTRIAQLAAVGCQFQICMFPLRAGMGSGSSPLDPSGSYGDATTLAERVNLANQITILQRAGIVFDVVLCTEPNITSKFTSATAFKQYTAFYGPAVCNPAAYFTLGGTPPSPANLLYNPAHGANAVTSVSYYPGDGYSGATYTFFAISVDYYGSGWKNGTLLDGGGNPATNIEALADAAGKPFGISEWGNNAGNSTALTSGQFFDGSPADPNGTPGSFCGYLISFFSQRLAAGKTNYNIIYFNSNNNLPYSQDTVTGPTDFKVAGIQAVSTLITSGAAVTSAAGITGSVLEFRLYLGGSLAAGPVFSGQPAGSTGFSDAQGNAWSVFGLAEISARSYRFQGELSSAPKAQDPSGKDVWVPVTCGGILRRLQQGNAPVYSPMRRAIAAQTGTLFPEAYWPCEDLQGATSIGSVIGGPLMTLSGGTGDGSVTHTGPAFAADSTFACSAPLPVLNGSSWHGVVPAYQSNGSAIVRFLLSIPSGGAVASTPLVRVIATGTVQEWSMYWTAGGGLSVAGYGGGSTIFNSGPVSFGVDGNPVWVSMELRPAAGGMVNWSVNTLQPGGISLGFSGSFSGTIGNVTDIYVSPAGLQTSVTIGHMQVQSDWQSLFGLNQPLAAWAGETAGDRFARVCSENGLAARIYGFPDVSALMGAQPVDTLPKILQDCEDADRGMIYEPRKAYALGYRTLASLLNQAPKVTLDWTVLNELAASGWQPPTDDDLYLANDITVTRTSSTGSASSGATYRTYLDDGSAMSISPPPAGAGDYATSVSANVQLDTQLPDLAGWLLHLGTVNESRYPAIPADLARSAVAGLFYQLQELEIGDHIAISTAPAWLTPDLIKQLAAQANEELGGFFWRLKWNGIPESCYETGIFDDPVYGRGDTDGAQLDTAIGTADTTMLVDATGPSGILWTTAAADFPFDISMNGERITVTNVTGSASPQTFTITRSVNGVVLAHQPGEAITLFFEPVYAIA